MYIEHYGPMTVKRTDLNEERKLNDSFDYDDVKEVVIDFKPGGWYKDRRNIIEATVPVKPGSDKFWKISGKWSEGVSAFNEETQEEIDLFTPKPYPDQHDWQYLFTKFAINLNNCPESLKPVLPPTDSRLRPDQRLHELGEFSKATQEKLRLEHK